MLILHGGGLVRCRCCANSLLSCDSVTLYIDVIVGAPGMKSDPVPTSERGCALLRGCHRLASAMDNPVITMESLPRNMYRRESSPIRK